MVRKILVADDDKLMVQTLCDVLALYGWHAIGVQSAEDALQRMKDEVFSCLIMDIKMGGEDGFSAIQRIKRQNPSMPVVLMTAYTPSELVAEARRNGDLKRIEGHTSPDKLVNLVLEARERSQSVLLLSQQEQLLARVHGLLKANHLVTRLAHWSEDFILDFGRTSDDVTLITIPKALPRVDYGILIAGIDAGVWVALSGGDPSFSTLSNKKIQQPDRFLRKPFSIPTLVEELDALVAA